MILSLLALAAATAIAPAALDRLFRCELGRPANLGAARAEDLQLIGKHVVVVLQPSAAVETPERTLQGAVAAKSLRLHDRDKVLAMNAPDDLIDGWPTRLELLKSLPEGARAFVSLGKILPGAGTATASAGIILGDGTTLVTHRFLQGPCTLEIAPRLAAKFDRETRR